jgi:hypothetical protein
MPLALRPPGVSGVEVNQAKWKGTPVLKSVCFFSFLFYVEGFYTLLRLLDAMGWFRNPISNPTSPANVRAATWEDIVANMVFTSRK